MRELPPISIRQYVGKCKGLLVTQPIDWVVAHTRRGDVRVALVGHAEGSTVRFIRILPDEIRELIRKRVAELRKERGGNEISPFTIGPPDPRIIRGYLKGERFRKRKRTVEMPDGMPSAGRKRNEPRKRLYVPGDD